MPPSVAVANGDHRGFQFLQWFIEEQVEEESKLQHLVDLIESGINLFQAEATLGSFE
jgi:ferritin